MKKHIFFTVVLCGLAYNAFAQPQTINTAPPKQLTEAEEIMRKAKTGKPFDVRRNCLRGDNLFSYRGQELYVPAHPDYSTHRYKQFRDPSITGKNPDYYNTHYYHNDNDGYYGTEAKYVVGRTFVVDRISQSTDDVDEFIFEMHDKSTRERVSFEYSVVTDWHRNPNYNPAHPSFPFIVMGHFNYLKKKYIGKIVIVACNPYEELSDYTHKIYVRKANEEFTEASLAGDYTAFKISDVIWDKYWGFLCFVLKDLQNKTYYSPIEGTYNEPEYSLGVAKKFLSKDWDAFVRQYGEEEMLNVMRGDIHIGMDSALVRLSAGCPRHERFAHRSDGLEWLYLGKDVMVVFDDKGKVKDLVEGVPSEEATAEAAAFVVGVGAFSFGWWLHRIVSFPFRLFGRLLGFLGF